MKTMIEQAMALQASRKELLTNWRSMIEEDSARSSENAYIYSLHIDKLDRILPPLMHFDS